MIAGLCGVLGPGWLWARRVGYAEVARALSREERARLGPYFDAELLRAVRVAEVERIEEPVVFEALRAAGVSVPRFEGVYGMCFGDVVAVRRDAERGVSTLFHELVHTVQMRRVGVGAFCREYVREYLRYGYTGIGFEEEAFGLQERFERGEDFEVR